MNARAEGTFTLGPASWADQWRRAKRSYAQMPGIRPPSNEFIGHEAVDDTLRFFIDCYHVKDWLKNDTAVTLLVGDVESFVKSSPPLCLCGDLANGAKHLSLTSTKIGDLSTGVVGGGLSGSVMALEPRFHVVSAGQVYVAADIARDCMTAWEGFLQQAGLLPVA